MAAATHDLELTSDTRGRQTELGGLGREAIRSKSWLTNRDVG